MKLAWALWLGCIVAFYSCASRAESCDGWANFAKIVTYKGREQGVPREQVKRLAEQNSPNPSENQTAFKWIDYVYDNPDTSPVQIWKDVYAQCLVKHSI